MALAVPEKCYFYNLKQSIDDPYKPFSAAALDSISGTFDETLLADPKTPDSVQDDPANGAIAPFCDPEIPLYSQTTLRKTISPITEWIPFNPGDNRRLGAANPDDEPILVGHDRLLFQVNNLSSLRPIYWSIPYATRVCGVRWVFSDTLTPIDPVWDEEILPHYMNFLNNVGTYKEILESTSAGGDPALMRVIAQRLNLKQGGKVLGVDLMFSPLQNWVYIFKADSSYVCSKQTASSLLQGSIARGIIAILKPFDFQEYKRLYSQPDRPSDDVNYEPSPINNLILVFHGVGQKLSNSYTRINFVYAIDKLRVEVQQATDSPEVFRHFPDGQQTAVKNLVLAVNWRTVFNSNDDFNVSDITVPSLLPIRQAFGDALLDIPLYMSANRRPQMLASAAYEANRLYSLVLKHHPSFKDHGRVHLVGHSLGALITADLLTSQPTYLTKETKDEAPFKFQTHNYFTTGSMLGVFMILKGEHLYPREEFDKKITRERGSIASVKPEDRPFGCFAVKNLYNIIHQSDLLSFLVNPTVLGAQDPNIKSLLGSSGYPLEADELPSQPYASTSNSNSTTTSTGATATASNSEKIGDSPPSASPTSSSSSQLLQSKKASASQSSLSRFFSASFSKFTKSNAEEEVEEEVSIPQDLDGDHKLPEPVEEFLQRLKMLNENGQIDWKIPQPVSYIPSHYLKVFTAHFDYWSNKEIARFLAIECGRKSGAEHILPEHRVKWKYHVNRKETQSEHQMTE